MIHSSYIHAPGPNASHSCVPASHPMVEQIPPLHSTRPPIPIPDTPPRTFRVQRIHGAASPLRCPRSSGGWWRPPGWWRRRRRSAGGGAPWGRGRRGVVHPRHSGHRSSGHAVHACRETRRRTGAGKGGDLLRYFFFFRPLHVYVHIQHIPELQDKKRKDRRTRRTRQILSHPTVVPLSTSIDCIW